MRSQLRFAFAAVHVACFFALWLLFRPEPVREYPSVPAPAAHPLAWLPANEMSLALPLLNGAPRYTNNGPASVTARGAFLADLDRGEVLWARRADVRYPVASLTKLTASLAMVSLDPDPKLDDSYCVTPELWPVRPGATSRFETGRCHVGWDYVGTALVHSDNRGAMGMMAVAGVPFDRFIQAMDDASADLGMTATWADPTGLEDNNLASARDIAKSVVAVAAHPVLAGMASAPSWTLERRDGPMSLVSTNRLRERYEILAAKTGYTDTAGYNFTAVLRTRTGRLMVLSVLGARSEASRFSDAERMLAWADQREVAELRKAQAKDDAVAVAPGRRDTSRR
jgi:D-alanyl-D-alanine endopeptidase (penicillin-binding protein 7)